MKHSEVLKSMSDLTDGAVKMINLYLEQSYPDSYVTDEIIEDSVNEILKLLPYKSLENNELFDIVSAQHSSFYEEESKILEGNLDHEKWLNPINGKAYNRDIEWKFWDDYQRYLIEEENFSRNIVHGSNGISRTVNKILAALDDPTRDGLWDRRGLIVGEVQSGKTANYIGLISKAADAGYKLIIVLAGMYNDLRAQTQQRIDQGFIGYNSKQDLNNQSANNRFGVGNYMGHLPVMYYTNGNQNGDFSKQNAEQTPTPLNYQEPIVLVVKKNKSIMDNINNWISRYMHRKRNSIDDVPLMIIDDECDSASVNTKRFNVDDDQHVPTAINSGIRDILAKFDKSVYIGYTATPFANILIKRNDRHRDLGEDLFPRDFILNIPRPSNHIGPEQFFGISGDPDLNIEESRGYPLLYTVRDGDMLLPDIKELKTNVIVPELNQSLLRAIKSFILSCAARMHRGQIKTHNSMLIHVSHYINAQRQVMVKVEEEYERLRNIILNAAQSHTLWTELQTIWEQEYMRVSQVLENDNLGEVNSWEEIKVHVREVVDRIDITMVNGYSKDALEYKKLQENGIFQNIIAIGGNRLARGLTLESLTISYFLRTSKMYDTLLQMGRWFGYRDNYLDLCRIYTTRGLISAYRHIALATKELKDEFDRMYEAREKPDNWGLKIRSHPDLLLVTGYGKSHWATKASITFDGALLQSRNIKINEVDCDANTELINNVFLKKYKFEKTVNDIAYINHEVSSVDVIDFVNDYKNGPHHAWNPKIVSQYIRKRNNLNQITDWTVAILNAKESQQTKQVDNLGELRLTLRNGAKVSENIVLIDKAILSPSHEGIDLKFYKNSIAKGKEDYPHNSGAQIRHKRAQKRALLLLYPIYGNLYSENDVEHNDEAKYGLSDHIVFGAVISFSKGEGITNDVGYVFNEVGAQLEMFND